MLQMSCALTLALKYKVRTKRKVFSSFGRRLTDPDTRIGLEIPKSLKVKHKFSGIKMDKPDKDLKTS